MKINKKLNFSFDNMSTSSIPNNQMENNLKNQPYNGSRNGNRPRTGNCICL